MHRLSLAGTALFLFLGACTGAGVPVSPTPIQVADEHPHFADCARYTQVALPDPNDGDDRANALEACLAKPVQMAARPS